VVHGEEREKSASKKVEYVERTGDGRSEGIVKENRGNLWGGEVFVRGFSSIDSWAPLYKGVGGRLWCQREKN